MFVGMSEHWNVASPGLSLGVSLGVLLGHSRAVAGRDSWAVSWSVAWLFCQNVGMLESWMIVVIPVGPLLGASLGALLGHSGAVTGCSSGAIPGCVGWIFLAVLLACRDLEWFCQRNVVEIARATPQQLPVISHCVTH